MLATLRLKERETIGLMACGRKRKYVDDASTSLEDLSPSTTPTLSTTPTPSTTPMQLPCLCRRLLSPLHPLRHDIANFHFRGSHDLYRTGYIAIHTVVYSSKAPVALKKPSGDPREQLELNSGHWYHFYIPQEVCGGYCTWSQVPPEVKDLW